MSTPFDPSQDGQETPVDGRDEDELSVEEGRADEDGSDDPSVSPVSSAPGSEAEQDEAGGGPVFRRPHAGDSLRAEDLEAE